MFAPSPPSGSAALQRLEALRHDRCRRAACADAAVDGDADRGATVAPDPSTAAVREDPVLVALAAVEAAIQEDPGGWSDAAIEARVIGLAEVVDRAKVAQVLVTGVWDAREVWAGKGFRGPWGWLAREGDLTFGEARSLCQAARVARRHDVVADHLRAGSLKCRQIEQLALAATGDRSELFARDVEVLCEAMAKVGPYDASQIVRRWKSLADDALATDDAVDQHERRRLHHSQVGDGYKTDALGDLESGALIDQALASATDPPDDSTLPGARSAAQRRYDALVKIARHWLDHRNARCPNSPAVAVNLLITETALTGSSADGFDPAARCDLVPGGPIARSTAQRLLCDSVVGRIVLGADGEPIDLGRTQRLFSPAQRRAMIARDGPTCVVPYCTVPVTACEAHHLDPYEADGPTDVRNGAFLCSGNHHDAHDRAYRLERAGMPGHYRWTAPDGRVWTTDRSLWGTYVPRS
jgi:hypothetical protein